MRCRDLCLALFLPAAVALADSPKPFDWPQWQGPDRNAVSKEQGLLKEWPKDGPPLAWEAKGLGGGYSAPSIAAGRVFGMGNRGEDEAVWALSKTDGKELWAARLGPAYQQQASQQERRDRLARRRSMASCSTFWALAATSPACKSRTAKSCGARA